MLFENILLALESLRTNKLRAFLTMLGIIIGIGSVITIMTVGDAVTNSVYDAMQSLGGNNIVVSLSQRDQEDEMSPKGALFGKESQQAVPKETDYFSMDMINALCEKYEGDIRAISATEEVGGGTTTVGRETANVDMKGVSMGYFYANDLTMVSGSYLSRQALSQGIPSAMVSDRYARKIFGEDTSSAIGKSAEVKVNGKYYTVSIAGVYKYQNNGMAMSTVAEGDETTDMYVPLKFAKSITGVDGYQTFSIVTKTGVDSEDFSNTVERYLSGYYRDNHSFRPSTFSMATIIDQMSNIMSTVTLAISAIAGIALIVGGIGVMNIMLVSITERTREIGTRKALGATNASIRMQFIVEAIIICLLGGVIGIALGVSLGYAMSSYLGYPTISSPFSIILSLAFSMAVGVFFGYYPANKAAKMNPIDALRYE